MITKKQVEDAEKKMSKLLARMQEIDKLTGGMSKTDPERLKLVAEKHEIMPRYRGAKGHLKNLRRAYNSLPDSERNENVEQELAEVVEDVDREELLGKLYQVLIEGMDRYMDDPSAAFPEESRDVISDFMDWWEHTHEPARP